MISTLSLMTELTLSSHSDHLIQRPSLARFRPLAGTSFDTSSIYSITQLKYHSPTLLCRCLEMLFSYVPLYFPLRLVLSLEPNQSAAKLNFPPLSVLTYWISASETIFRWVIGTVSRIEVPIQARIILSKPRLRPRFYRELTENPTGNWPGNLNKGLLNSPLIPL